MEIFVNIEKRRNQFRNTVEPSLRIYFNKPIKFSKTFSTRIVRYKTDFFYNITRLTLMIYLCVNPKEKSMAPSCGIVYG